MTFKRGLLSALAVLPALLGSAGAQTLTVVPAPLTGPVTVNAWEKFDSTYPGITLACGKPFHYILARPANYDPTRYKYPLNIWFHPNNSGNENYLGSGGNLFKMASGEAGSYNTAAFQTRHPGFVAAPSADQTNGNGTAGSCTGGADAAVENWGGWVNNGTVGSGTHYSGDTGPNTFATVAMVNDLLARYPAIDRNRVYINGFSLGGHVTQYLCNHHNAYTGDKGRLFAACAGSAGANRADSPVTADEAARLRSVPQWMYSGLNDGTSPHTIWNTPLCTALGGNPGALTGIVSPAANRCGTSEMRYTLAPGVGHSDTEANGAPVWSNQVINDFIYAQSANVAAPPATTGKFTVAGGKIIDPAGKPWRAAGVNVYWLGSTPAQLCPDATCSKLLADFPGVNFVRLVAESGYTQAGLEPVVTRLTNLGIVVSICDFNISPGKPAATGATLAAQTAWYAGLAQTYKDNPRVWIESQNEMYDAGATMAARHKTLYDTVRAISPDKIVVIGYPGGGNPGTVGTSGQVNGSGMTPSVYASMRGIVGDLHAYAWMVKKTKPEVGDSTDIPTIQQVIRGSITGAYGVTAAQTITSAEGKMPIIMGEFGNSTSGLAADVNGVPLVEAVATMPEDDTAGWAIFAAGTLNVGVPFFNALTDGNSDLTNPYGLQGQRLIKAATSAIVVPPLVFTESANLTAVPPASAIVGSTGEKWTLVGGQIAVNGAVDATTRDVLSLAYVNHTVWQQNASHLWWGKTLSTDAWSPPTGTATSPLPVVVIPPAGPSPEGAKVIAPSTDSLNYGGTDWTISAGGKVIRAGVETPATTTFVQIEVWGGAMWAKNTTGQWFRYPTGGWTLEPRVIPVD